MERVCWRLCHGVVIVVLLAGAGSVWAGDYVFSARGESTYLNGAPILVKGLRCSNALISDLTTQELAHLEASQMKSIILAILFIAVCLAGILAGIYTYLGSVGTERCRADSIARGEFLSDPSFSYKRQYWTKDGLESVPANVAEQYKDSARDGWTLAMQGNWDKTVMFTQSLLLLAAGVAGLISLKRPEVYD